jgi:uncharacterized protein (DUF1697 family)
MTLIALLRGINVSGQKSVKMVDLAALLESLGFENVRTYIQSGNVVFASSSADVGKIGKQIGEAIRVKFGFEVTVIVRTAEELGKIISGNPLLKLPGIDEDRLHVTLLSEPPDAKAVAQLAMGESKNEKYRVLGREAYLYCPDGYGTSKLNNSAFEKKLGVRATTRTWKTMRALYEMARR